jgi:hypothetical protein
MSKPTVAANDTLIGAATSILAASLANAQGKPESLKSVAAADAYMAALFTAQMGTQDKPA